MTRTVPRPAVAAGVHIAIERVARDQVRAARTLLARDGAVILTGWPVEQDSVVAAAATVLGTRLREIEPVREQTKVDGAALPAHRDGAFVVVDVHGRATRLRLPDPDYVQILCAGPAPAGGQSYVVDGYRLLDRLRDDAPELYAFLTTIDVDLTSRARHGAVPYRPQVSRLVEWTRGGRRVVRTVQNAQPVPRDPQAEQHQHHLDAYAAELDAVTASTEQDTLLQAGEILFLDNYRCLHGVRAHDGPRTVHVGRCLSQDSL